jgi:hypothetical protein
MTENAEGLEVEDATARCRRSARYEQQHGEWRLGTSAGTPQGPQRRPRTPQGWMCRNAGR